MSITYKQFENHHSKAVANLQTQWQSEAITYGFIADTEDEISAYDKEHFYESWQFYPKHGYVEFEPNYMRKELFKSMK